MSQGNVKACATPDFVGVNLRRDTVMIGDNELASASNVDFYAEPGVIRPRAGTTLLTALVLSIKRLGKLFGGARYARAGTVVYADSTSIVTGLTGDFTTFTAYRPLNDTTMFMFIADSSAMNKHRTSSGATKWGIDPPDGSTVPYYYAYTSSADLPNETSLGWYTTSSTRFIDPGYKFTTLSTVQSIECVFIWEYEWKEGGTAPFTNASSAGVETYTGLSGAVTLTAGPAGSLTGAYSFRYTYARMENSVVMHESNPSPVVTALTVTATSILISGFITPTDAQVTHIRLYRTTAGGASYLFDQNIAVGVISAFSSQADTALTDILETDNDVPPLANWCWNHLENVFLVQDTANPHYVWFSKRFLPESFPPENFIEVGSPNDPIQCGVSHAGACGLFTRTTKYSILGNDTSGFAPQEAASHRGTPCPNTVCVSEFGVIFVARDGVFSTTFNGVDVKLSETIESLFLGQTVNGYAPINWDDADEFSGAVYKGRYFFNYCSTDADSPNITAVYNFSLQHWSFYDLPITALNWEEGVDLLVAGDVDGDVFTMETTTADQFADIALSAVTKDFACTEGATVWKLFQWLVIDADTDGETVTVSLYVDDTLRGTFSLSTSKRTTQTFDTQGGALGHRWRVQFDYTGQLTPKIYQVVAYYAPLGAV